MPDPAMALLAFAGLTLLTAILFWPVAGVVPRVRRMVRVTDRVRFEDVLKQLYQLEYARLPATVESVAGGVQLPRHQVLRLLHELEESAGILVERYIRTQRAKKRDAEQPRGESSLAVERIGDDLHVPADQ